MHMDIKSTDTPLDPETQTIQGFRIQLADWHTYREALSEIRHDVFIEEQGIAAHEEWDKHDEAPNTRHYLALDENDRLCATARLINPAEGEYKITRLAVQQHSRKNGLGGALIQTLNRYALSNGATRVFLHAQMNAIDLYKKYGFDVVGDAFIEASIEHIAMELDLTKASIFKSSFEDRVIRLNYPEEFVNHAVNVVTCAVRRIDICSADLRADIFSNENLLSALSKFARSDREAKVRILVQSSNALSRRSQKLIELCRRLSSKIEIKVLSEVGESTPNSFICVDSQLLVFFNNEASPEGFCCYSAGPESEANLNSFDHAWSHLSQNDPNFGQLYI